MLEEREGFSRVVSECLNASTDMLGSTRKFFAEIKVERNREGISLLEVKNRDLLTYMNEVAFLMGQMSFAESIQGCSALERCVFLRTVLERIRPIEQKLKPYVERAMSATGTATISKQVLRPRPDLMKVDGELANEGCEESDDGTTIRSSAAKKYVPPKVVPLRYDESEEVKEERVLERARRRALQSSLISDLRAQYNESPEEVQEEIASRKTRHSDLEKQRYEEDYMVRLQVTKKERHERKLQNRQNILDELLHFGDYMAMNEGSRGKKDGLRKKRKHSSMVEPKGKRRRDGCNRFEGMRRGGKKMSFKRPGRKHSEKM